MGFLDNVTSAVNRGTASVQRTSRVSQLKMQINGLMKQRRDLAAQLGASLYDVVKEDPAMRAGREPLFDGIANIDEQRAALEAEIVRIEAETAAAQEANVVLSCPRCGSDVMGGDLFCSGCGLPIAEVKAASAPSQLAAGGPACPSCGAPLVEGDAFCMMCGAKIEAAPEPDPIVVPAPDPVVAPAPDPIVVPAPAPVIAPEPVGAAAPSEPASAPAVPVVEPIAAEVSAEAPVEPTPVELSAEPAPAPTPGSFCAHCGGRVEPGDAFCGICGSSIES